MKRILIAAIFLAISGFGCQWCYGMRAPKANATKFSVNSLFKNEMVLQREMRIPVWDKGVLGEIIAVEIDNKKYTATVDKNGKWMLETSALPIGGPYTMKISGKTKVITLKNVMSGDGWICSGQSNMQWTVKSSKNAKNEIAAANYPNIRLFQVRRVVSEKPLDAVQGKWTKCTPATVKYFSAVGYFFGRDLYKSLKNVPIGLIHSSWGGTPAGSWTPHDYLSSNPMLKPILVRHEKKLDAFPKNLEKYKKEMALYKKKIAEIKKSKTKPKKRLRRPHHPYNAKHPHRPAGLYNAMINPLIPYGIKGAIWYQGESNAGRAYLYRTLLSAMIKSWRKSWNQGDFAFLIVELANYGKARSYPVNSHWAELCEAQNMTAARLPACGVASAIDISEAGDLHPKNKQDVGKRLQLAALKIAYDKETANSAKVKNPTIVAVRYAWSTNPKGCNLYNKEGLPATPFRTDSWKGVTYTKR